MKALVVESSSTMRSVLRRILSMRGFEVAETDSGQEALNLLGAMGTVDLILVDWTLPEMNNLDFITRMRRETAHASMVIMLAASEPGMRDLHRALIAGADDYLMKPFTSMQIDAKLALAGLAWQWTGNCERKDLQCR